MPGDSGAVALPRDLRHAIWRGGALLLLRNLLTALIGFVTVVVAIAWIGIGEYGIFAGALGIVVAISRISYFGVNAYLLRGPDTHDLAVYHQAFSFLGVAGLIAGILSIAAMPWITAWMEIPGFEPVAVAMLASLPLVLVSCVPQGQLERKLDYPSLVSLEFLANLLKNGTAIALLAVGLGVWGLVLSWWIYHIAMLRGYLRASGYHPRWVWQSSLLRSMLGFGLKVWSARSALNLRELVNPLVVGKLLGGEAMGKVAVALMLCETAAMVLGIAQRMSGGLFGAIQSDRRKITRAISEGTFAKIWLLGPALIGMCWAGTAVFPVLLNPAWSDSMQLFPYLALYPLVIGLTQLRSSALYTYGLSLRMLALNSLHVLVFAVSTWLAIPVFGMLGIGIGSAAGAATFLLLIWMTKKQFEDNHLWLSVSSAAAFAFALFMPQLGPVTLLGLVLVTSWPAVRHLLVKSFGSALRGIRERRVIPAPSMPGPPTACYSTVQRNG